MEGRRAVKKLETRQRIADEATSLFLAHGFDSVTLEDVAAAAQVSKMTVFNYFSRKEDLFLDRQDDLNMAPLREAIRLRPAGQGPVAALRALFDEYRAQQHPFTQVNRRTADWWRFIAMSPSLQARLRELHDEAAEGLAAELDGPIPRASARLAAGLIVLTMQTAREEMVDAFDNGAAEPDASATFFAVLEQGLDLVDHLTDPD